MTLVALEGETPKWLGLRDLPDAEDTLSILEGALRPFLAEGAPSRLISDLAGPLPEPLAGLHLVYVMGHAWVQNGVLQTAVRVEGETQVLSFSQFLRRIESVLRPESTVLIVDTCHAGASEADLSSLDGRLRLWVAASATDESAIALPMDQSTRLALALAQQLMMSEGEIDLLGIVLAAGQTIGSDDVIPGQQVSYALGGSRILLRRGKAPALPVRRARTVKRVRAWLLSAGAVVALASLGVAVWYRGHAHVELLLNDVKPLSGKFRVEVSEQIPQGNSSRLLRGLDGGISSYRAWLPTTDLLIRLEIVLADGSERVLAHHVVLEPGWDVKSKWIVLGFPDGQEVVEHKNMAWVPRSSWRHGRDLELAVGSSSFWIDVAPPTVAQYLPLAEGWQAAGRLLVDESVLLTTLERRAGLKAVGAEESVGRLGTQLGEIFSIIDQGSQQRIVGGGEIALGLADAPCEECPAPVTRHEAEFYCGEQGKRLPTDLEWELAARGVDGRVYPWGDRFDATRSNVAGLPPKGSSQPGLRPVWEHPEARSPFGLVDLVGNAGDWVTNVSGSYERVFMGGTYRFSPEDSTVFLVTPFTEEDLTLKEITVRCVQESKWGLGERDPSEVR
ncbi:MAG TPA: SUMF1/EgtB/PvdO family nonheme iron enzyme [Thermoanaerobaculia bacterium]|nr:SUMF1/EgtB/PvdO family nonheme iron enzyme [Thermoanaerobaculia bacterium]